MDVFQLSTGKETKLFLNKIPLKDKKITAEVCIHHLWFSDEDYKTKGTLINVIDLANINSCSFISTQDLGKVYTNNKFEIIGRFDTSDIRGCNLMVL